VTTADQHEEKVPADAPPPADAAEAAAFALRVWSYKQGEAVSLLIHLGDRLGLYRALAGAGPTTASGLAERTGLHPRWLLEWLRGNAAAGLVGTDETAEHFELSPEGTAVLADETGSLLFAAGAFHSPLDAGVIDGIADAFRTGIGLSYDQLGPSAAHRTERMLGPWARLALVPRILPALEGVVDKLTAGAVAADVGCGAGVALLAMAAAFPASEFHGYDPSRHAIERAAANLSAAGLSNVSLHQRRGDQLPAEPLYDLVITFDCLHDMTHPDRTIAAIRRAIRGDGTWLIKDIRSSPRWADNRRNPVLAMFYGFSVTSCMSSALSEPDGAGLGTLGFNPEVAEHMCRAAGFTRFQGHDFDDPANLYYEVRP
jgi:SAM-dependent methyltransferase